MCVMAYIQAGKDIDEATMEKMWDTNPDGGGFMYAKDDSIYMDKGFFDFDEYYASYIRHKEANPDADFIVHMRISTGGKLDYDNCHPHIINNDWAFAHNGVMNYYPKADQKEKSDTILFNEHIMQNLPDEWWDNDAIMDMIEEFIGQSKLIFMHKSGYVDIANEDLGTWDDGIWYSNVRFRTPKPVTTTYYGAYGGRTASYYNGQYSGHGYNNTGTSYYQQKRELPPASPNAVEKQKPITQGVFSGKAEEVIDADETADIIDIDDIWEEAWNEKYKSDMSLETLTCASCIEIIDDDELSSYHGNEGNMDLCVHCAYDLAISSHICVSPEMYDQIEKEYINCIEIQSMNDYENMTVEQLSLAEDI